MSADIKGIQHQNQQFSADIVRLNQVVQSFDDGFPTKEELRQLTNRVSTLEHRDMEHSRNIQTLENNLGLVHKATQNLEGRLSALEGIAFQPRQSMVQAIEPNGPTHVDFSALLSPINRTLHTLIGRMQVLDNLVTNLDKKLKDNETHCLTAHKSIIPKQRIEKIEEDLPLSQKFFMGWMILKMICEFFAKGLIIFPAALGTSRLVDDFILVAKNLARQQNLHLRGRGITPSPLGGQKIRFLHTLQGSWKMRSAKIAFLRFLQVREKIAFLVVNIFLTYPLAYPHH